MDGAGGNVAPIPSAIRLRSAIHGERHFPVENDVRGYVSVGMIGIEPERSVLPDVGSRKPLSFELLSQLVFVWG